MLKKIFIKIFDIRRIIKRKNAQIRAEREKLMAAETANRIYASYILCLAARTSGARIKKSEIARTVGKYRAEISATEDEYIISVKEIVPTDTGSFKKEGAVDRKVGKCNGACADKAGGGAIEKNKI